MINSNSQRYKSLFCIYLHLYFPPWTEDKPKSEALKALDFAWNVSGDNRRQTCKLPVSLPTTLSHRDFLNNRTTQVSEGTSWVVVEGVIFRLIWPLPGLLPEDKSSSRVRLRCPEGRHHRDISCLSRHGLFAFNHWLLGWYILCCVPLELYLFLLFFYQVSVYFHHLPKTSKLPLIILTYTSHSVWDLVKWPLRFYVSTNILFMITYILSKKIEAFSTALLFSFWVLTRITLNISISRMHLKTLPTTWC